MSWKVIVLDFDGVIVESVEIKDRAFRILFADYSQHLDEITQYHLSHNATLRFEKFRYITETILKEEYTPQRAEELSSRFSDLVVAEIISCPFVAGAIEFLEFFRDSVPLYLVSVSPQTELEEILKIRGIKRYFRRVYAARTEKSRIISEIVTREKISSEELIFIGDTAEDYLAAAASRVSFIARDSGKVLKELPVPVYKDLAEIKSVVGNNLCLVCTNLSEGDKG